LIRRFAGIAGTPLPAASEPSGRVERVATVARRKVAPARRKAAKAKKSASKR
jgi:hypothetical protein